MRYVMLSALLVLTLSTIALAAEGDQPRFWRDVTIRLEGALYARNYELGSDLELYLKTHEGKWDTRVLGYSAFFQRGAKTMLYNWMDHEGTLIEHSREGNKLRLVVDMTIHDGPWVSGGPAKYTIELTENADGTLAGTYSGTFTKSKKDVGGPAGKIEPTGKVTGSIRQKYWPSPVPGVKPFEPGEHPRLIFRKSDLPALRKRMKTPQGQAILARLYATLGSEDQMPEHYQKAKKAYGGGNRVPRGGYTLWHGMGFGFLYQLTGEKKYAELAKKAVDLALKGQRDRDQRYSFVRPGGKLRAGSSYAAIAMAYDFCYDAWEPEYRKKVAATIAQTVFHAKRGEVKEKAMAEPVGAGLVHDLRGGQLSPHSNHYGAWNGGGGTAILAVLGDPGVDNERMQRAHRIFQRRAKRALEIGYGTRAYFFEGTHGGRLNSNTGLVSYLQALRVAEGKDFIAHSEEARWLLTKWIYELARENGRLANRQRGIYAGKFGRGGMSTGGDFSQGFGICPDKHIPAVLWTYENIVEPGEGSTFDAINYPHRAVYAFVNWPIETEPVNPGKIFPPILHDQKAHYTIWRSGWSAKGDRVITMLGRIMSMNIKDKISFPTIYAPGETETTADGVGILHTGQASMAVDFTGKSGAPVLMIRAARRKKLTDEDPRFKGLSEAKKKQLMQILGVNEQDKTPKNQADKLKRAETQDIIAAGHQFHLLILDGSKQIPLKIEGEEGKERIVIGNRTLTAKDGRLVLGEK
ncbi:MAG: hypothetical protein ACLFVU_08020 [Phycisphaerae bacterium]